MMYFYNHIVIPIFNDDGFSVAGFIARNPSPKCIICEQYHQESDPCLKGQSKWKNTKGFHNNSFLYNFWNAKKYIEKTNEVILVEGPADVWRLHENCIYNSLAMFGTSLTSDQKIILENLPITKVKIFLDPDEPGILASKILQKYLERFYTIEVIEYLKQPSDCNEEDIKNIFKRKVAVAT